MPLTDENKKERVKHVCASEVSAICGLNPWKTPQEVWSEKVGETQKENIETDDMNAGNELEPAILTSAERIIRGYYNQPCIEPNSDLVIHKGGLLAATPDGFLWVGEMLERKRIATVQVKAPGQRTSRDWADPSEVPDGIPLYVLPQVITEMGCAELTQTPCIVAALVYSRPRVYRVRFSQELFDEIQRRAEEFWRCVSTQNPPPVSDHNAAAEWIKNHYRQKTENLKQLPAGPEERSARELAGRLSFLQSKLKDADKEATEIKAKIQEMIGDDLGIQGLDWKATWKKTKDQEKVDWEKLALELGATKDQIRKYTQVKPGFRRFDLKLQGGSDD